MSFELSTTAGLWLAVVFSGLYHGVNPGMGWPLAVSAGLMNGGRGPLLRSLAPLAFGHLLSMLIVLLPFALLTGLLVWQQEIRIGASVLVVAAGVFLWFWRRHPRALARIAPHKLTLWSFAIALAHGAGLMLVPIYLGLCAVGEAHAGHAAAVTLMTSSATMAVAVSAVHAGAMIAAGGVVALLVHDWLGLKFLSQSWFNLDRVWAGSLVLIGATALWLAWVDPGPV
ncbi:MAG: hypothetical protein AAF334_09470 [Pseudomonadota bacterium]